MPIAYHVVASTRPFLKPLLNREGCADLWKRLRKRFPKVAACILMPDHLHLLLPSRQDVKWELGVELRAWARRFHPGEQIWAPIPEPNSIPNTSHLKRHIRYVHLNPCRDGLAADPLEWEWSTHRDMSNCTVDSWPDLELLQKTFGTTRLSQAVHRYVSADPSVAIEGTPAVRNWKEGELLVMDPIQVHRAAKVACREAEQAGRGACRDLAVRVIHHLQLPCAAEQLGISRLSWYRALKRPVSNEAIQSVLRILADSRCRKGLSRVE